MVNTLRKKKDKESLVIVDTNGSVTHNGSSTLTSVVSQMAQQVVAPVEEKNRVGPAPVKVCSSRTRWS